MLLSLVIGLTPQGRAALAATKDGKAVLNTFCVSAIEQFGTQGPGCTSDLDYYQGCLGIKPACIPYSPATTTGVKGGTMDLLTGKAQDFGSMVVSWLQPSGEALDLPG